MLEGGSLLLALEVRRRLLSRGGGALGQTLEVLRLLVLVLGSGLVLLLLELLREGGRIGVGRRLRRRVRVIGGVGEGDGLLRGVLPVWWRSVFVACTIVRDSRRTRLVHGSAG